ncbi:MAG: hypothetical protein RTV41_08960 [Candidatus Thorarchaeota archaeon]
MSYERSDDRERHSDSEENEEREYRETDEREESPEDKADEAAKDLEREEEAEKHADKASRELDETESESSDAKDLADEASRELDETESESDAKDLADETSRELDSMENNEEAEQSMEDDLGHDLDEVRDGLHDRFVNDMDRQLEEPSQKDTETDEQDSDTGSSSDMTESSESYEDAGNGMMYALESKGGEAEAQTETAETEESHEDSSKPETSGEEPEATTDSVDDELTNRFTRQEQAKTEEADEDSTATDEGTTNYKQSETYSGFSKPETSADGKNEGQSETESDMTNSFDTKSEYSETEQEQSNDASIESEENKSQSSEVTEPVTEPEVEQSHETESQDVSNEVQSIVDSAESELEEVEEQEIDESLENKFTEDEDNLEDLEDFVKRAQDILDEMMYDDHYDYVQDSLTGEMQRVPRILSEYETEGQRKKRRARNVFAQLTEEERELFKRTVREKAESKKERSAEEVERQWSQVVNKAQQDQDDMYERLMEMFEKPKSATNTEQGIESHFEDSDIENDTWSKLVEKVKRDEVSKNPLDILDAYDQHFFYFKDKEELEKYLQEACRHLGIKGKNVIPRLNELLKDLQSRRTMFAGNEASPVNTKAGRIKGESLRFIMGLNGETVEDLKGKISKITGVNGQGGIFEPKFPDENRLLEILTRLYSTMVSDGHIKESGKGDYFDPELSRIQRVIDNLDELGQIKSKIVEKSEGLHRLYIPSVISSLLVGLGFPVGDRTMQNRGLPKDILDGPPEILAAYLEEMVPEEGCFSNSTGISWNRTHGIYGLGKRGIRYQNPALSKKQANFVKVNATSDADDSKERKTLPWSELVSKAEAGDETARSIMDFVNNHPNRLIKDETKVAGRLGINVENGPYRLRYYKKTGRVTLVSSARTKSFDDAEKWGQICPPNDVVKKKKMMKWLSNRREGMRSSSESNHNIR